MSNDVISTETLSQEVTGSGSVAEDYRHYSKVLEPRPDLILPGVHLKWYDLHREGVAIPAHLSTEARTFLQAQQAAGTLQHEDELGFVVHHLCGDSFFYLVVNTWRHSNELWETVFYKDGLDFPGLEQAPREGLHKPGFCVWELGAVMHEQRAWQHYLRSPRDAAARAAYLNDRFEGTV